MAHVSKNTKSTALAVTPARQLAAIRIRQTALSNARKAASANQVTYGTTTAVACTPTNAGLNAANTNAVRTKSTADANALANQHANIENLTTATNPATTTDASAETDSSGIATAIASRTIYAHRRKSAAKTKFGPTTNLYQPASAKSRVAKTTKNPASASTAVCTLRTADACARPDSIEPETESALRLTNATDRARARARANQPDPVTRTRTTASRRIAVVTTGDGSRPNPPDPANRTTASRRTAAVPATGDGSRPDEATTPAGPPKQDRPNRPSRPSQLSLPSPRTEAADAEALDACTAKRHVIRRHEEVEKRPDESKFPNLIAMLVSMIWVVR